MKIGHRIRQIFDTKPRTCTVTWFARNLNCERRNIYRIFERDNIDIRLLARIGAILQHDFFADISDGIVNLALRHPQDTDRNTTTKNID